MASCRNQLYALHVKNTLIRLRNWGSLLVELGCPIMLSVLLCVLNATGKMTKVDPKLYPRQQPFFPTNLTYTSDCPAVTSILANILNQSKKPVEMIRLDDDDIDSDFLTEVKFFFDDCKEVPKRLKYQIVVGQKYEIEEIYGHSVDYSRTFSMAHLMVVKGFTTYWINQNKLVPPKIASMEIQIIPDLPYMDSSRKTILKLLRSFFGFVYFGLVCYTTKGVVEDKETKIKESMKLMGLSGLVYWLSWLLIGLQIGTIISVVFVICTFPQYGEERFLRTNPALVIMVLILYVLNNSTFAMAMSCVIQKARNAVVVATTIFIAAWFGSRLMLKYTFTRLVTWLMGTIVPQAGINVFVYAFFGLEIRNRELTFSNMDENVAAPHQTCLDGILMLVTNTLFNVFLLWYFDNVNPGEFGVAKPYNFCITKDYWFPVPESADDITDLPKQDDSLFEKPPQDLKPGVMVRGLVKMFGGQIAVAGTSMDLYQDQISVLLGHNGAGKTTTISMITGFLKPTSGTAILNGYDITKNLAQARSSLGLCPQHDILFNKLTCKEHLVFYLRLRGQYMSTSKEEIERMLIQVGLKEKFSTYAMNLSGGQRRKLSVACSFIGNNKTVFLDEPSSGLDPSARRDLWDFLKGMRHGRTILLTTHYMDEADVLGDRIMIMAEGVVKCGGTPMFLKQIYGTGYQMNVVKKEKCSSSQLTSLVRKHIPEAKRKGETPNEIYYLLPDEKVKVLPNLFAELERKMDDLHISSFGITATSMEDVFIRVGEGRETKPFKEPKEDEKPISEMVGLIEEGTIPQRFSNLALPPADSDANQNAEEDEKMKKISIDSERKAHELKRFEAMNTFNKNEKFTLFLQQMRAILIKRVILFKRSLASALVLLVLPVCFTILGIKFDLMEDAEKLSPPVFFSLDRFKDLVVPVFSNSSSDKNTVNLYVEQFSSSPGVSFVDSDKVSEAEVADFLLKWGDFHGKNTYEDKMIVGAVIEKTKLTFLYQQTAVHAKGISMQLLTNAYVQSILGIEYSVQLGVHHELPALYKKAYALQVGTLFCLGFAMALVPVIYIYGLIAERATGAKHLQALSGVSPLAYWLGAYIFDMFLFTIIIATIMCGFTIYPNLYLERGRWALTLFILVTFAMAMFPYLYAVQVIFKNPANGVISILCFNVFVGVMVSVTLTTYRMSDEVNRLVDFIHWFIAVISPNYVLTTSLLTYVLVATEYYTEDIPLRDYLENDSWTEKLGTKLLLFIIHFVGGWVFIAIIEFRFDRLLWYNFCKDEGVPTVNKVEDAEKGLLVEDDDVQAECLRINEMPLEELCSNNAIVIKNLRKTFRVKCQPFVALHSSSLALPQNECLGLLGQNGAGKTTTFKMLTGDNMVSSGDGYVKGLSIKTKLKIIQTIMGYCPQFDALHEKLTGRETLYLYARLRGVPEIKLCDVTDAIIDFVTLRPHEDKLTCKYSGGNKRKLSVGISIIGDPLFIMLDEPTAGMDPVARRTLWTVLHLIRSSGRTLVLTSHSMEECEALCTRIAIMAKGRILCLGSPQHLKNKYGQGYTVVIRASVDELGKALPLHDAQVFVLETFPKTQVFATQEAYVHLQVPDTVPLSTLFTKLELAKHKYKFQFFTVQQTTLEQVFLMFMKET